MNDRDMLIDQLESLLAAHVRGKFGASTADANERLVRLLREKADEVEIKQIRSTCTATVISDLPIGQRIRDALSANGIVTKDDLIRHAREKKLRRLPGIGIKAFTTLQKVAYEQWGMVID